MANFKIASVFSNNMVLQREKNIRVFGEGENSTIVTVQFMGSIISTKVLNERWSILLPPQTSGTGYEMRVTCGGEEKRFINIAIGEVWLAGGQSNMEFELKNCTNGMEMLQNDKNPNVRFYYTPKNAYMDENFYEAENQSEWKEFSEEAAQDWSAVGYIFAEYLAKRLDVTIGIIGCNWGGTSASNWMSESALAEDKDTNTYLEEYYRGIEGKSEDEQIREYGEYEAYAAVWNEKYNKMYAENPEISWQDVREIYGDSKWPGPVNCINPYRPVGLYECMLLRVLPYTIRGFIYYQGESDDHKPTIYQKLLTRLIRNWREDWEDLSLPFLMVQLPMHRYKQDPDWKNWCLIREAQMNTFITVKNTGIVVALDCGEYNEIHPKNKRPVGERLALQALASVYKQIENKDAFGPLYQSFKYIDGGIELSFNFAEDGFVVKGKPTGFEIAGEDRYYVQASVEIRGQKIFLSSPEVLNPLFARYCWSNYCDVTFFGINGIPLAPFRTSIKA